MAKWRARVYFDGFNFYHGAFEAEGGGPSHLAPYKWLDLRSFCADVLPGHFDIGLIRYITSPARQKVGSSGPMRQSCYLSALEAYCGVEVDRSSVFRRKTYSFDVVGRPDGCPPRIQGRRWVEKGADVNLVAWMLEDCYKDLFDTAIVVSDDQDLVGAFRAVRRAGKRVEAIHTRPTDKSSYDGLATIHMGNRIENFKGNLLPQVVELKSGAKLYCPREWQPPKGVASA